MKKIILIITALFSVAFAQIPDPMPNTYVNDAAGVLTAQQIQVLNDSVLSIEKSSSVQIAIVLVNQLPSGMDISDFTLQIGRKWHVGNAHNGLVYAASISEHKQRLEVADGLQGDIPDLSALQILEGIKPHFKQQQHFEGLLTLLAGIHQKVDPVAKEQSRLAAIEYDKKVDKFMSVFLWVLMVSGAGFICWYFGFKRPALKARKLKEAEEEAERERLRLLNTSYRSEQMVAISPLLHKSRIRSESKPDTDDYSKPPYTP